MAGDGFDDLRAVRDSADFSSADKLVLMMLKIRANEDRQCWPSIRRLALDTGLAQSTVRTTVKRLVKAGAITITPRVTDAGDQDSHKYTLAEWGCTESDGTPPESDGTGTPNQIPGVPHDSEGGTPNQIDEEAHRRSQEEEAHRKAAAAEQAALPGIPTLSEREQKALEALESESTIGPRIRKREQLVRDLCAERPDLDIAEAIRAAGRWCRANPTRAPKTGFPRFLLSWVKGEGKGPKKTNGRGRPAPQGADADASELERIRKQSEAVKAQRRKAATA